MPTQESLDEQLAKLATRLRAGDASAADEIAQLLHSPLNARLRQRLPEDRVDDVYQETWRRFFEHLLNGKEPDSYVAWFLGIARMVTLEGSKGTSTLNLSPEQEVLLRDAGPSLERHAEAAQLHRKLVECLGLIPKRYARVLEGYAKREDREAICKAADLQVSRFHMFLHRARKRLQACIDGELMITGLD